LVGIDVDDVRHQSSRGGTFEVDDCAHDRDVRQSREATHDCKAVYRAAPGQFRPLLFGGLTFGAERGGRHPEVTAVGALARNEAFFLGCLPERCGVRVGSDLDSVARQRGSHDVTHAARPRIRPLTGSDAGPPVASAYSASLTWLIAVPRICSTASMM